MLLNTVVGTWIMRPLGTFIDHDVSHYVMFRLQLFSYMSRLILDRLVTQCSKNCWIYNPTF